MGLMDKIGSKLGSKDNDSTTTDPVNEYPHTSDVGHTKSSDYNNLNSGMSNLSTGTGSSGLGHTGSPTTGSSGLGSSGLGNSGVISSGLGHSHSTSSSRNQMPGGFGGNDSHLYGSGANGSNSTGYSTSDRAGESLSNKVHPHSSLDPYSTKGQNAAYDATPSAIPIAGGREVGNPTHESSHLGRDGALAGGAGAAGVGAYETSKHGHHNGRSSIDNNNEHEGKKGGVLGGLLGHSKDKTHDDKHHTGRDAGVAGTAAYEAEKHGHGSHDKHGHHNGRSSIDNNNHYGRDAGIAGGVGAAGYEAEKHRHGSQSHSGNHLGRDTGIVGSGYESEKHGHGHHNGRSSFDNNNNSNYNNSRDEKHHYGRDAGIAGGVGAAGYEAEKHHHNNNNNNNNGQHQSGGLLGHNKDNQQSGGLLSHSNSNTRGENNNHYGRDAGVAGGVGTAAYEAAKHHDHNQSSTPYDSTSGQSYGSSGQSYGNTGSSHGHHNNHQSGLGAGLSGGNSQNRGVSPGGMSIAKKLSAAYEAGYRDAMAHAEAEGHKSHHY